MVTGSKELIRDINTKLVLETIITHSAISRAATAKYLGLTKATVSAIVSDLIRRKLVVEIGSDDTTLGRKPILLSLNKKAAYVICIDIGVDTISGLVSDLSGESQGIKQIRTPKNAAQLLEALINLIESLHYPNDAPYGLAGISLGIHGVTMNNKILFTPYYNFGNSLAEKLEKHFATSVYIENEANLSVIGEKSFFYDYANIANISIHSGIGLGLILNHKLYTGYSGRAGEFGHTIIEADGRQCPCGNLGCFEQYVSERVLLKEFGELKGMADAEFSHFAKAYEENDSAAIEIMNRFVKYMTLGINNILNSYNPDIVIINSRFTNYFPQIIKRIEDALTSKMNSYVSIVPSALKDTSILLGGICIAIQGFLGVDKLLLSQGKETL